MAFIKKRDYKAKIKNIRDIVLITNSAETEKKLRASLFFYLIKKGSELDICRMEQFNRECSSKDENAAFDETFLGEWIDENMM